MPQCHSWSFAAGLRGCLNQHHCGKACFCWRSGQLWPQTDQYRKVRPDLNNQWKPWCELIIFVSVWLMLSHLWWCSKLKNVTLSPSSIALPEKLEHFANKYAEHSHEKWSAEKVRAKMKAITWEMSIKLHSRWLGTSAGCCKKKWRSLTFSL